VDVTLIRLHGKVIAESFEPQNITYLPPPKKKKTVCLFLMIISASITDPEPNLPDLFEH
jgi:hypothetical protein